MKVERIEILPLEVPYHRPLSISLGATRAAKNVLVKVFTDQGIVGYGEVSPFVPAYSGETQETAVGVLHRWIAPHIIGKDPFDVERIHQVMDKLVPGNGCAKAGIDVALHDIMGKALGVPIYQLMGGLVSPKIPLLYAVSSDLDVQAAAEEAASKAEQGFKGIMVKIGESLPEDTERLRAVRSRLGDDVPLIADPNQAYSRFEAIKLARWIRDEVQALEGPVKRWDLASLREVRRLGLMELIADESVSTPISAMQLAREEAADLFLIKLLRSGGFYPAKRIAAIAESAGIGCYAASMTNLGIGHAANLHFAASTKLDDRYGHGFENLFQIFGSQQASVEKNISDVPPFTGGCYQVPSGPGLGVELNEENVKRYATGKLICRR